MRALAVAFAALALLTGCATSPPAARTGAEAPAAFTLDGRIAVKYDSQHSTGNFHWLHDAASDDITMLAPLGVTVAHIRRDANGALLEASGKHYAARDAAELMQTALGWSLPLEGLPYWVMALPSPSSPASMERNEFGQISLLRQAGWDIRYTAYAANTANSLPLRLTLQRENLEIRLLIDEWKTN
jgi:outer membrane lipoprotein LolB